MEHRLTGLDILVMILYFAVLAGMGYYFSRRQKGTDDYFRGGGRVPGWAAGLSLVGTGLSAITYMSVPAKSFQTDWGLFLLNFGTLWVAPLIVLLYVPKFRSMNLTSAYEFLERRFNLAIRIFGSGFFILFQLGRMAIVLYLPSLALSVVTGIDIYLSILLMGVISLLYTMAGGVEAVVWTDVVQVFILLGGAILALIIALFSIEGGVATVWNVGMADAKFRMIDTALSLKSPTIWVIMLSSIFTFLTTYSADQTLVQRYFVTKDERAAIRGVWINAWIAIPTTILFFLMGTVLYVYYKQNPGELCAAASHNDSLLPWFIISKLPHGIAGLLIVGIFAASMSSLSASMNSVATAYTIDFHSRLHWDKRIKPLTMARIVTLVSGILGIGLAIVMAVWDVTSLWDEYNRFIGLIISGLGGVFFLGVATRRANGRGVLIGLLIGTLVQITIARHQAVHLLLYSTTGFVSCVVVGYLASLILESSGKNENEKE